MENPLRTNYFHSPSDLESYKAFPTVFSKRNALGAPRGDRNVHIHCDIWKPLDPNLGRGQYTRVFPGFRFSPPWSTLEKTLVEELTLFPRSHSPTPAFPHLLTGT